MQDSIMKNVAWAERLEAEFNANPDMIIDKQSYSNYLQMLFASMYVFSAQGRIQALQLLDFEDGCELYKNNELLSEYFKTKRKFGFQPIILANISVKLFRFYWEKIRPMIQPESSSNSPLWLTYEGVQCKSIGSKISSYFLNSLEINTSSTRLRALVETVTNTLHR